MKGDFSRFTFNPRKNYSRVLQQQGRVALDADWNEQAEIQARAMRNFLRDAVGPYGVPATKPGFEISWSPAKHEIRIGAGRAYVDGLLVEAHRGCAYSHQPWLPDPPRVRRRPHGIDLIYLDVWERHVTAVQDPDLREVALGGPDTATRIQTIWQVRFRRLAQKIRDPDEAEKALPRRDDVFGTLTVLPTKRYQGHENRLYRVEIHRGGSVGQASFKWSRDNGSVVFGIDSVEGSDKLRLTGEARTVESLAAGDWVELMDEATELAGKPGVLARVKEIGDGPLVTLDRAATRRLPDAGRAWLQKWDHRSTDGTGLIPVRHGRTALEDGVSVQFSGHGFAPGDHWVFPARTATQSVERRDRAPARRTSHAYMPLATLQWPEKGGSRPQIIDLRRHFAPWPHYDVRS